MKVVRSIKVKKLQKWDARVVNINTGHLPSQSSIYSTMFVKYLIPISICQLLMSTEETESAHRTDKEQTVR